MHALGIGHFERAGIRLWIVPACMECNNAMNKIDADTVRERKKAAKTWLRKRYARYLSCGNWTDDEMEQLGYNLRQIVESGANIKEWVKRRLEW